MRDVIWTIIVIWLLYRLIDIFRAAGSKKTVEYTNNSGQQSQGHGQAFPKKDYKTARQKSFEKEGEYVDFEEVKK